MSSVGSADSVREVAASIDLGPGGSIQLMFAKLQLAQSEICKSQAEEYMEKIKETQEEQKLAAQMIDDARALQQEAEKNGTNVVMPPEMVTYFEERGLTVGSTDDNWNNADEWNTNLTSLQNYQEQLGTETQTDMVYLQDLMGQYNSFLQGASKTVSDNAQTLQSILTR